LAVVARLTASSSVSLASGDWAEARPGAPKTARQHVIAMILTIDVSLGRERMND
jgi:hypothetical protein